jgi:SsrA-binding protein
LLNKHELKKLEGALKDQGLTIVPLRLFINEKGWAKLEIALAKGKKLFDKREDIKKKDLQRETARKFK